MFCLAFRVGEPDGREPLHELPLPMVSPIFYLMNHLQSQKMPLFCYWIDRDRFRLRSITKKFGHRYHSFTLTDTFLLEDLFHRQ